MILETLETGMLTATAHTLEQDVVQTCCQKTYGISIDCAEILKIWKLVDDLLKRPNTKGVLGIHQLTNKIH